MVPGLQTMDHSSPGLKLERQGTSRFRGVESSDLSVRSLEWGWVFFSRLPKKRSLLSENFESLHQVLVSEYLLFSPRIPAAMIHFDEHMFQMGWFNHQLVARAACVIPLSKFPLKLEPCFFLLGLIAFLIGMVELFYKHSMLFHHSNVGGCCLGHFKLLGTQFVWWFCILRGYPVTLPQTNMAPENGWLEHRFPFGKLYLEVLC